MKEHLSILLLTTAVLVTTAKSPRGLKDPDRRKLKFMKKFGGESCCLGFAGGIAAHHQAIAKSCDDSPEFKYDEGLMKIRGFKHPELCLSASRSYIGLERVRRRRHA